MLNGQQLLFSFTTDGIFASSHPISLPNPTDRRKPHTAQ